MIIVRKHIQDLVPKAIMKLIISRLKNSVYQEMTHVIFNQLKDPKQKHGIMNLFVEDENLDSLRKEKSKLIELLKKAISIIKDSKIRV